MSDRRARRRRVAAGALHQVGAVDPGRTHADQISPVAGHRIGPLLDLEPPVDGSPPRAFAAWHDTAMKLHGVHHVTCITADAPQNVEFYAGTLGLRLVKKTVNQDDPTVYHLFYADEDGSAGADITFFEYPGATRGRAGDGMVHRVVFRVGSRGVARLLAGSASAASAATARSSSTIPRASRSSWSSTTRATRRSSRAHPEIPEEHALRGFAGVRAYASHPERSAALARRARPSTAKGAAGSRAATAQRLLRLRRRRPTARGLPGAGTVHHVAWASPLDEHEAWRRAGARRRRPADARDRPLLLQVDLLPRAERRALRDRDDRPRVHRRRAARDARRVAVAAAELRAPPRAGRAAPDAAAEPARRA